MKKLTITTLSAILLSAVGAHAEAYTKPIGYETLTIEPGFNMVGVRLHEPVLGTGTLGAPSGSNLPTDLADLDVVIGDDATVGMVIIEVTSGDNAGMIIECDTWTGANFTGVAGLTADLEGDVFQARLAPTLAGLFGADNSAGFQQGTLTTADVIWVASGAGSFNKYYYADANPNAIPFAVTEGWKTSTGGDATDVSFNYLDGIFIQRRGASNLSLVVTGSVKRDAVNLDVSGDTYNFFSGIFPVSTTLEDTGLSAKLQQGTLFTADVIWMPSGPGSWSKYYYAEADLSAVPFPVTEGWKSSTGADAANVEITSGFIIQRRSAQSLDATLNPNAEYSAL